MAYKIIRWETDRYQVGKEITAVLDAAADLGALVPTFMLHRAGIFSMTKTAIAPSASSALFPRMFPLSWQRQTSKQRMIWGG